MSQTSRYKWVWVTLLETDYFFHCAIEQVYFFFSQNQSKEIFFQNIPGPPEYQMDCA